jgi:hypothetical protein
MDASVRVASSQFSCLLRTENRELRTENWNSWRFRFDRSTVACEHKGPTDVMEMAEGHLRNRGIPPAEWEGLRFAWGENLDTMWKSVYTEIERRDGKWVVTAIDRSDEALPPEREGFLDLN